jgi:hypothetical protein
MHTPDSAQLFDLLQKLQKLVGPKFGVDQEEKEEFIRYCCEWFVYHIPRDKKGDFIRSVDSGADVGGIDVNRTLYWTVSDYLNSPPTRSRRDSTYPLRAEDEGVREVPTEDASRPYSPLGDLPVLKWSKTPFEKDDPDRKPSNGRTAHMPIAQLLTDLQTMHARM